MKLSSISLVEAVGLAYSIKYICKGGGLDDVEVEIAEMPMMQSRAGTGDQAHVLSGPFDDKPYIGASIGPCPPSACLSGSLWCGTFAAYLSARKNEQASNRTLLALMNDRVCFDVEETDERGNTILAMRPCLDQSLFQRAFKSKGANQEYLMAIPAVPDYIATEEALSGDYKRAKAKYERQKTLLTQGLNHPTTIKAKEKLDLATNALSHFRQTKKTLGLVYGTGGDRVDVESQMPMDWGVIKALDADPVHSCYSVLNKASQNPVSRTESIPLT